VSSWPSSTRQHAGSDPAAALRARHLSHDRADPSAC
jgi:hypothetical protein